jgi:hypothetical protein
METTAQNALTDRIALGVMRRKRVSIKDIKDRAIQLGFSMLDLEEAMEQLKNDPRVRVYDTEIIDTCEDFWLFCPFVSDTERQCHKDGWVSDECKELLMTPQERHKYFVKKYGAEKLEEMRLSGIVDNIH